jgi:hypothetical protein
MFDCIFCRVPSTWLSVITISRLSLIFYQLMLTLFCLQIMDLLHCIGPVGIVMQRVQRHCSTVLVMALTFQRSTWQPIKVSVYLCEETVWPLTCSMCIPCMYWVSHYPQALWQAWGWEGGRGSRCSINVTPMTYVGVRVVGERAARAQCIVLSIDTYIYMDVFSRKPMRVSQLYYGVRMAIWPTARQ